ncbi:MAG: GGDEF domain-containing protein [Deltaproteobacteria bacterium CG11_big_fil_rev_8_21_14_0_20_47_16]|nr:MAG: GGDEF domain-containing protein [Deltaproteobacteria bacterium CG11_big_fil_rev_8_21_14_0_20_47_16]
MSKDTADRTVITAVHDITPDSEAKRAYILFLTGPLVGKIHLLEEGTTSIGRSGDVDIAINDTRISRHHITIRAHGNKVSIEDLGSTNGTYVNGKRINGTTELRDGDKIQLSSNTIFKFAWQDKTENIFHKELYKMAVLDPATALYNKRYFLERFTEEFSLAKRSKSPLSILIMDIDFFKKVNDTYGHLAGDLVLQQVGQLLKKLTRYEDVVARYGGEEFIVLLRGNGEDAAYLMAERIRKSIESSHFEFEGKQIPVTVSLGLCALPTTDENITTEAMIKIADERLYHSKESGRNRVTRAI